MSAETEPTGFVRLPQPPLGRFGGGRFGEHMNSVTRLRIAVSALNVGYVNQVTLVTPAAAPAETPVLQKKPGLAPQFQSDWRKKKPARR